MEPNYLLTNILVLLLPFGCYYLGIVVRKVALPSPSSPPWSHQLLLGVPTSMAIVSPLVPVFAKTLNDVPALLITLGVIIEHGMVVNEAAADLIKRRLRGESGVSTPRAGSAHDPDDPNPQGA